MGKMQVLIVDDEPFVVSALKRVLRNECDCLSAANGAEGLKLAQSQSFDLIVSDINMPLMDGVEMVKRLRALGTTTPILMVTGGAGRLQTEAASLHAMGIIQGIIAKPWENDKVLAQIIQHKPVADT